MFGIFERYCSGTQRETGTWLVSVLSGAMAFTRTPWGATSSAKQRVKAVMPVLNAE